MVLYRYYYSPYRYNELFALPSFPQHSSHKPPRAPSLQYPRHRRLYNTKNLPILYSSTILIHTSTVPPNQPHRVTRPPQPVQPLSSPALSKLFFFTNPCHPFGYNHRYSNCKYSYRYCASLPPSLRQPTEDHHCCLRQRTNQPYRMIPYLEISSRII